MKNVCLFICLLFFQFFNAQELQNANWIFGHNAGIKFTQPALTPLELNGSGMVADESCASVSDEQGNLLFYTDGRYVWDKNHNVMPNGSGFKSHESSTQGVIIVPKPGSNNIYYIVTIDGFEDKQGLYYSEVNMQLNGNLGGITSNKNIPLKDHSGVNIDGNYNNLSEKLTSTKHANGIDYWVVTQIKDKIYSYLISSSGFNVTPAASSTVSVDLSFTSGNYTPAIGGMKISPSGNKIGVCYIYWATPLGPTGAIGIGSFNNSTGQVVIDRLINNDNPYNLEFSPSGQYIYYTTGYYLRRISLSNYSVALVASNTNNGYGLQLAINNKIYMSCDDDSHYLSVINNPDAASVANVGFQSHVIYVGNGVTDYNLPQWVHKQPDCPLDLILVSTQNDVLNGQQDFRQASNSITASNIVNNGATGKYHAGNVVYLKPGFQAKGGSNFRAYIEGCSGDFAARASIEEGEFESLDAEDVEIKSFMMSPNPANEKVTIEYDDVISNLMVTSIEGVTMFNQAIGKNSYDLYIANYKRGIYIVTIQTQDGKVLTEKLMKN